MLDRARKAKPKQTDQVEELALVVDDLVEQVLSGEGEPSLEAFLQEHHRFGGELCEIYPVIEMLVGWARRKRKEEGM